MKSSSYVAFYFLKVMGIAAVLCSPVFVHAALFPASTIVDGVGPDPSLSERLLLVCGGVLFAVLGYFVAFRFRVIRYDDVNIEIVNGSRCQQTTWSNVSTVVKIFGTVPPVYRMTFKWEIEPVYFIMSMFFYVSVGFWSWDFTGFYKYAKSKLDESAA